VEQGRHITILVVDDEPAVLALVRRCLDDQRVTLIEASSGKDALELIMVGQDLDLVITDLRMLEMEGDELARQVRAVEPDVKVLVGRVSRKRSAPCPSKSARPDRHGLRAGGALRRTHRSPSTRRASGQAVRIASY
jgi:CheY-like chemotaxis protein